MLDDVLAIFTSSTNAPAGCSWRITSAPFMRFVGSLFRLRLRGTCLLSGATKPQRSAAFSHAVAGERERRASPALSHPRWPSFHAATGLCCRTPLEPDGVVPTSLCDTSAHARCPWRITSNPSTAMHREAMKDPGVCSAQASQHCWASRSRETRIMFLDDWKPVAAVRNARRL